MLLLETTINGAFWTLQVEVFGSLLVLAAFLIERRAGVWTVAGLAACLLPLSFMGSKAVIAGQVGSGLFYSFLLGYLAAVIRPLETVSRRRLLSLLALALIGFYAAYAAGYVLKQWLLLVTTLSATIIVAVLASDRCRDLLQWRPLRVLGAVSYSFYALHPFGLDLAQRWLTSNAAADWPRGAIVAVSLIIAAATTFVVALPMHRLVERPGNRLGRRLATLASHRQAEAA
jgi:peptidoglycan/LPS O-acetylase OafA/YrhL